MTTEIDLNEHLSFGLSSLDKLSRGCFSVSIIATATVVTICANVYIGAFATLPLMADYNFLPPGRSVLKDVLTIVASSISLPLGLAVAAKITKLGLSIIQGQAQNIQQQFEPHSSRKVH